MRRALPLFLCAVLGAAVCVDSVGAASLTPSRQGLSRQVTAARSQQLEYVLSGRDVPRLVAEGTLVRLRTTASYEVKEDVSYPYALPEVARFLGALGRGYETACGETLVVTSALRPRNEQPPNASSRTVHPTGMAIDIRRSWSSRCRGWLEARLVDLEARTVLEAARETRPPHYHIVVFPDQFERFEASGGEVAGRTGTYLVQSGDTLWQIAHRHATSVEAILAWNGLRTATIRPGQVLQVPRP